MWALVIAHAAPFEFTQTNWSGGISTTATGTHPTAITGWTQYTSGSTLNVGSEVEISVVTSTTADITDSTTHKDSVFTTATWTGNGQITAPTGFVTTDLTDTLEGTALEDSSPPGGLVYDSVNNLIVLTDSGPAIIFDPSSGESVETEEGCGIAGEHPGPNAVFDATTGRVYYGGFPSCFGHFQMPEGTWTERTPPFGYSLGGYDPEERRVYLGGFGGEFGYYDIEGDSFVSNSHSTSGLSGFWSTQSITQIEADTENNIIYVGGTNGQPPVPIIRETTSRVRLV